MKKKLFTLSAILAAALLPLLTAAQNYGQNRELTGGEKAALGAVFGGLAFIWVLIAIFVIVGLAFLVFWILMIIDCAKRDFKDKALWLVILIVSWVIGLNWLAAIIYYFAVKKKLGPIENNSKTKSQNSK